MGVNCALKGEQQDNKWSAVIDAQGYIYNISGTIQNNSSTGTLSDPQTLGSIPYKANLSVDQLTITITDMGQTADLNFTRSGTSSTFQKEEIFVDSKNIDQRLVGNWRHTETYVSGQFSFATDYHMQLLADGTMYYSEGRTAGGGPDISADTGAGDVTRVSWKSENDMIYVNGGSGWEYLARYYKENGSLLLTYGNGNKWIWEKI